MLHRGLTMYVVLLFLKEQFTIYRLNRLSKWKKTVCTGTGPRVLRLCPEPVLCC